ncbi:MAG: signal peptidase I, partial [Woeseia sp.]
IPQYRETLPNGVSYITLDRMRDSVWDNTGLYIVPAGHYFMMGDNRDNSQDSRYIGTVPETHLVGEAVRIWMHMDGLSWPRWERVGMKIQ